MGKKTKDEINRARKEPNEELSIQGIRDDVAKKKQIKDYKDATDPAKLESAAKDLESFRSGLGILTEEGTPQPRKDTMLDEAYRRVDERKARRGIARGLKDLSRRGALTGDLLKEARQRATDAGVSEEQFSSFMEREGIKKQNFATAAPTESREEATQNVMYQREFGTGLGELAARQDPNYVLGSASPLNQPPRQIGTKAGALRRAARRLRKQGYGAQAGQMAMASETARLTEPSIVRPEDRKREMDRRIEAGNLLRQTREQERKNMQEAGRLTRQYIR